MVSEAVTTTQSLQSSLMIQGVSEPSPELNGALKSALAAALNVNSSRVNILSLERVVDAAARRLSSGIRVKFEVLLETQTFSAEAARSDTAFDEGKKSEAQTVGKNNTVSAALVGLRENPAVLVEELSEALEEQGQTPSPSLLVEVGREEVMTSVTARSFAGPWGACEEEKAAQSHESCSNRSGKRFRSVWCADAANKTLHLHGELCAELQLVMEETCVVSVAAGCNRSSGQSSGQNSGHGASEGFSVVLVVALGACFVGSGIFGVLAFSARRARRRRANVRLLETEVERGLQKSEMQNPSDLVQQSEMQKPSDLVHDHDLDPEQDLNLSEDIEAHDEGQASTWPRSSSLRGRGVSTGTLPTNTFVQVVAQPHDTDDAMSYDGETAGFYVRASDKLQRQSGDLSDAVDEYLTGSIRSVVRPDGKRDFFI